MITIYTIGHSNHTPDKFVGLLKLHSITALADVRSSPYSRFTPQFNRTHLEDLLAKHDIDYLFLGHHLGARPNDPRCYHNGRVVFEKLSQTSYFQEGLKELRAKAKLSNLAIMCAEKDPTQCHRMLLVCRYLRNPATSIQHILEDGSLEENHTAELRLMQAFNMVADDFFKTPHDIIEDAYTKQGTRLSYQENEETINLWQSNNH